MGNQRLDHLLSKETGPAGRRRPKVERPFSKRASGRKRSRRMILPHPPRAAEAARREAPGHASRETPRAGGIAQLVERQLCKLDAAGSSPAASTTTGFVVWGSGFVVAAHAALFNS